MKFVTSVAPHWRAADSVSVLMRQVLYALVPMLLAFLWFFGPGILLNIFVAVTVSLGAELAMLLQRTPVQIHGVDISGWDTHIRQGALDGMHANLLEKIGGSRSLSAVHAHVERFVSTKAEPATRSVNLEGRHTEIGDRPKVAHLEPAAVEAGVARLHALLAEWVDRAVA